MSLAGGWQLLFGDIGLTGGVRAGRLAWLKSRTGPSTVFTDAKKQVHSWRFETTPEGRVMKIPTSWTLIFGESSLRGTLTTPLVHGLGRGFVGGFSLAGTLAGGPTKGRGYLEYPEVR